MTKQRVAAQAEEPVRVLRTIIVDDEPVARQRLRRLLGRDAAVEIVAECANGLEGLDAIRAHAPDVVLLDIQMPEMDGFAMLHALADRPLPLVVFVTAFDEHALRAFDVHAVDYLLKPLDPDRLRIAMERARTQLRSAAAAEQHDRLRALVAALAPAVDAARLASASQSPATASEDDDEQEQGGPAAPSAGGGERSRFLVKANGKMFFVNVADVDWIEADGNYIRLHAGSASHMIRETIAAVEQTLPARFARIHRSAIVNIDRVTEMRQWSSGDYIVVLSTGARLKLSRSYRRNIESRT